MNFSSVVPREKRHTSQMYHPMHSSIASYWTEALQKAEMKHEFGDDYFLNNIHLIPDPLKRNLADTLFTNETPIKTEKLFQEHTIQEKVPFENMEKPRETMESSSRTLGGIGAFFSGVVNVLANVMFRTRSPTNYDCSDGQQGSQPWQHAKTDQDKNGKDQSYDPPNVSSDMNDRAAVINCESKLNQVLNLLSPRQASTPVWVRKRPKKVFVEPGSVEDSFEDAFSPEDFISLSDDSYIEFFSPVQYHFEETCETAAQKTKVNTPVSEFQDISSKSDLELKKENLEMDAQVNNKSQLEDVRLENESQEQGRPQFEEVPLSNEDKEIKSEDKPEDNKSSINSNKEQLITSCEEKLSKLKALLQEKRMKCTKGEVNPDMSQTSNMTPTESKPADKRFKNPNRRCSKRPRSKLKCRIEDDLVFANEVNLSTPPSIENSPLQHNVSFGDYFDEVCGRFRSASIGSEDSFQIVFNDSPKSCRLRTTSDCDSEDSFIIFEDSPESCYMSNDVFGDSETDSESEISDSGCAVTCKLAHSLTRTVSNLADDSLYAQSEDEVDFVSNSVENRLDDAKVPPVEERTGLLLDDVKKTKRLCQPAKKVQFSTEPPKVHVMRVWAFAARQARAGHWERFAVDRERFKRRIADVDVALSWVLQPQHRRRVMFQRFMPWWNQLKRKEIAEKKEREAEEQRMKEDQQRKAEEQRLEEDEQRMAEEHRLKEDQQRKAEEQRRDEEARYKEDEYKMKEHRRNEEQIFNGYELDEESAMDDNSAKEDKFDVFENSQNEQGEGVEITDEKIYEFNNNKITHQIPSNFTDKVNEIDNDILINHETIAS